MTEDYNDVICIDQWHPDESSYENGYYPEGTREKAVYFSPNDVAGLPLRSGWRYLFKKSREWAPWQLWMEVIAYRIGQVVRVPVPPAHVGLRSVEDPSKPTYGALIEWFYGKDDRYIEGARLIGPLVPDFDYRTGKPHCLMTILKLPMFAQGTKSEENRSRLLDYWAKVLTFDTLIGNVDRHPENWGIIIPHEVSGGTLDVRMSPAFDNGTALSYEQPEEYFDRFEDEGYLVRYLTRQNRARHHMSWSPNGPNDTDFFGFMRQLVSEFPETKSTVLNMLVFAESDLVASLEPLTTLPVDQGSCLTQRRLNFTLKLIMKRRELLRTALENS